MGQLTNIAILKKSVALTSSALGATTGNVEGVHGKVLGIYVTLGTGMTTATVTVANDLGDTLLNAKTVTANTFFPVADAPVSNDGATAYTNSFIPYINIGGDMAVTVASATAEKTMSVYIIYE